MLSKGNLGRTTGRINQVDMQLWILDMSKNCEQHNGNQCIHIMRCVFGTAMLSKGFW